MILTLVLLLIILFLIVCIMLVEGLLVVVNVRVFNFPEIFIRERNLPWLAWEKTLGFSVVPSAVFEIH